MNSLTDQNLFGLNEQNDTSTSILNKEKDYSPEPIPKKTYELKKNQITDEKKFEEIVCVICDKLPNEPIKCKQCGVIMCKKCLCKSNFNPFITYTCPKCSEKIMNVEIDTETIKKIDEFVKFKCTQCDEIIVYSK